MEDDRLIQRSVTDEIMYELMRLSGQEYVDEYAAVVKLRLAGKPAETLPGPGDAAGAAPGLPAGPAADSRAAESPEHPAAAGDEGPANAGTA
jgi:1-acyl-sn-glycerol-3-phosphate acyltransferase